MIGVLTSAHNIQSRCAALRLFSAGILHSDSSRQKTLRSVPLATVARTIREILDLCLHELPDSRSESGWVDVLSMGRFSSKHGEIQAPQTLVSGVVVAASLLHQMAQHQHYYDQHTQFLGADEAALQVSCCRVICFLLREWTRKRVANWKTAKLIPFDSAQLTVWQAVLWFSLYPQSGRDLMQQGLVQVTLPALRLHVKEMFYTAARVTEALKIADSGGGPPADLMAPDLIYYPSEDLAICIGAFSNLLEQFEAETTDSLVESGVIVEVLAVLFQKSCHRELVAGIVTIVNRMSCASATACVELVESGAEAVETYSLRGFVEGKDNPDCELSLVDWVADHLRLALERRMGIADDVEFSTCFGAELASTDLRVGVGDAATGFFVMITHLADTLSNLCRVKLARERVVSKHDRFMSVLCEFMEWDLRQNGDKMGEETASGWTYSLPVEAGLVSTLSSMLSIWTILVPVMYGIGDENSIALSLPPRLISTCLFVAAHVTDITCVDQVSGYIYFGYTCHI